jgi:hypothetical protein
MTFTLKQICDRYCVGETTVLGWIRTGQLQALTVGRALNKKKPRWRVTEEALAAFELSRTASPSPEPVRRRRQSAGVIEYIK